jgi:hypothetical protein
MDSVQGRKRESCDTGMNISKDAIKRFRLEMPHYERLHPWLSLLLDCYAIIDLSVADIIKSSNKNIVCSKGCYFCCYQTIPLSTIEVMGIRFYINHILNKESRSFLIKIFTEKIEICLFNIDGCCTVYPFRPIACRRYIISQKCCQMNEDPTINRQDDVLMPSRELLYSAIARTIPFYDSQNIFKLDNEHIFDFYKRNNVKLSSVYDTILNV